MKNKKDDVKWKKILFWIGISLAILMVLSYFIKVNIDSGANYLIEDSVLGIIIFHNILVFTIYIIILILLIVPFLINKFK